MSTHVSTHQAKEDLRNEDLKIYLNGEIVAKADAVEVSMIVDLCLEMAFGKD